MPTNNHIHITVILTSFNRENLTVNSLNHFRIAAEYAGCSYNAILTDDASTDRTIEFVSNSFDWVTIIHGNGSLYWNRGMYKGIDLALSDHNSRTTHVLWLNDDTELTTDSISNLLATYHHVSNSERCDPIIVGPTLDSNLKLSYSGVSKKSPLHKFRYVKIFNSSVATKCDAMNGNIVLISFKNLKRIGNLDYKYEHALGDIDYGLRAGHMGVPIYVSPKYAGRCDNNSTSNTHKDLNLSRPLRLKKILSRKELPPRSWLHFTKKHGGFFWPVYFIWPYIKILIK